MDDLALMMSEELLLHILEELKAIRENIEQIASDTGTISVTLGSATDALDRIDSNTSQ